MSIPLHRIQTKFKLNRVVSQTNGKLVVISADGERTSKLVGSIEIAARELVGKQQLVNFVVNCDLRLKTKPEKHRFLNICVYTWSSERKFVLDLWQMLCPPSCNMNHLYDIDTRTNCNFY